MRSACPRGTTPFNPPPRSKLREEPEPGGPASRQPARRKGDPSMKQYMLSVHSVEGRAPPPPEAAQKAYRGVAAFNNELQSAGAWVFAGGLHPPSTATVVRVQEGDMLITDGPFAESKEHIGGGRRSQPGEPPAGPGAGAPRAGG